MDLLMPKDCGPPPLTAVYPDPSTAFATLQAHAKAHGYAFLIRDTKLNKTNLTKVIYTCDKQEKSLSKGQTFNIYLERQRKGT